MPENALRVAELFAGCGGMAVGLGQANLHHSILVEWNKDAAKTVAHNVEKNTEAVHGWNYVCSDVRAIDWAAHAQEIDVVAGGPPCQPFSMGGKAAGHLDPRDMWPEAIRSVREARPKAFLFENVKGLLRPMFREYLAWVVANLTKPSIVGGPEETVRDRMERLDGAPSEYAVGVFSVNAADYGAAQKRHRVLIAGFRLDVGCVPTLPQKTHSEERLLWDQWVTGEYWQRHGLERPGDAPEDKRQAAVVARLRAKGECPQSLPWVTCRDAFVGLGDPSDNSPHMNHRFQAGAKIYPGHTGSPIDEPAKALKAGDHGVPGGENMLRMPDGTVRYFSVREAARLQGLPDDYEFPCAWTESMRQLGNAVPSQLAHVFGAMIRAGLSRGAA